MSFLFYDDMVNGLKKVLKVIGSFLFDKVFTSVRITNDDPFYDELLEWVMEHNQTGNTFAKLRFSTKNGSRNGDLERTLDYGSYLLKIEGSYFLAHIKSLDLEYGSSKSDSGKEPNKVTIRDEVKIFCFGNADKLMVLLRKIKAEFEHKESRRITVYGCCYAEWYKISTLPLELDTSYVITSPDLKAIDSEVKTWLKSKNYYKSRGIPYRRGWLLQGPPGTGKTSFVKYLAKKYGLNIIICNKKALTGDNAYIRFHSSKLNKSILLFEDIDCIMSGRKLGDDFDKDNVMDYATFINILDGLPPLENVLLFFTANDPSKLDAALLRPGRIDKIVELGYTNSEARLEMAKKFWPKENNIQLPEPAKPISAAEMQELLLGAKTLDSLYKDLEEGNYGRTSLEADNSQ